MRRRLPSTHALGRLRRMGKPVLTTADAALHLGLTTSAATRLLERLASAGLASRLRRGLWSLIPEIDPFLVVDQLVAPFPAYVSLQTALYLHGMIQQIPRVIYVASLAPTRRLATAAGTYSIHRVGPGFFGGFDTQPNGVRLATPEKALLDVLYLGPARSRLFAALPEVELPGRFDRGLAWSWLEKVERGPRRAMMERRLERLLGRRKRPARPDGTPGTRPSRPSC